MKAIILAAGRGSRMGNLTDFTPKCMVPFFGKPILEYILETLYDNAINEIVVIRGYQAEMITYPNLKYYDAVNTQNMVETLFCAKDELNNDLLILYSDVIMSDLIIKQLTAVNDDIAVCIDENWMEMQKLRFGNFQDDLESCSINEEGHITNIGEKKPIVKDVMGQYFGAIRLGKKGCAMFKNFYERKERYPELQEAWMRNRGFRAIYMTDFLQGLIDAGNTVKAITCNRGWLEFDSIDDLNLYQELKTKGKLGGFLAV